MLADGEVDGEDLMELEQDDAEVDEQLREILKPDPEPVTLYAQLLSDFEPGKVKLLSESMVLDG